MSDVLSSLLQGTSLRVTTALSQSIDIDLGDAASSGPPNPLVAWLKPEVQLVSGGQVIQTWAPYGVPEPLDYWVVAVGAVAVIVLVWVALSR